MSRDPYPGEPYDETVEEEVVETRRTTVPVEREVVRRHYASAGDPLGGLIGLIVVLLVILLILELLGIINLTTRF